VIDAGSGKTLTEQPEQGLFGRPDEAGRQFFDTYLKE
jgi:hypothetical protein